MFTSPALILCAMVWTALLSYATAHPTAPYHHLPSYHPELDASAESLAGYGNEERIEHPAFTSPYEIDHARVSEPSMSSSSYSCIPNDDAIGDNELTDDQQFGEMDRMNLARNEFRIATEEMGCDLAPIQLRRRFKKFITPALIDDLLSNDRITRWRATASIMMHRVSSKRNMNQDTMTTRPLYKDLTKEVLLDQIWEIMNVAPAEDARAWWYDRLYNYTQKKDFWNLFSENVQIQEAAVAKISGLMKKGHIWVKAQRGKSQA